MMLQVFDCPLVNIQVSSTLVSIKLLPICRYPSGRSQNSLYWPDFTFDTSMASDTKNPNSTTIDDIIANCMLLNVVAYNVVLFHVPIFL